MKSSNKGFTLVELSIVIVIIGLIIAGVTAGQALVKQSQLRAILTQTDQIRAGINAFKLAYNGLPGDITNGSVYWSGCGATEICDGDGNKQIGTALKNTDEAPESYIAWWQLNVAGLVPGSYTIAAGDAGSIAGVIGTTIPAAKYSGAGVTLGYDGGLLTSTASTAKNIMLFGAAVSSALARGAFLTPQQAVSLDIKADDGNALKGGIYGGTQGATALTNCADTSTGVYVLATTTATCTLGAAL